ncbi:MAG TPA: TlpA disulfide reductase family protein [Candidatus Krumholzibacteria bacterium]|nr:TlpA disulfide reductase family protein [Candidatus Krumholzibacteria bacterium]
MNQPLRVLALVALTALAIPAAAAAADTPSADFDAAVKHSREVAEAAQSYVVDADVRVSSGMTGMGAAMNMDMTARSAAVWPDRMANSQEGSAFSINMGTGPNGAWLHISQLGTCYQGPPARLVRDLEGADEFELTLESIYNFYAGLSSYVLPAEPAAAGAAGRETLTVGGREIPCLVFTIPAAAGEPGEGAPVDGEGQAWYDPASGLVLKSVRSLVVLQGGQSITQTITTTVTGFSVNQPVPDERFAYTLPEGVRSVPELDLLTNPDSMAGQSAPDITVTRLDGTTAKLSDFRGKVVFLNFWATWCPPCRREMPHIQTLWDELGAKGDVVFLGASSEDAAKVKSFLEQNPQYTFPIAIAKAEDVSGAYHTDSIPAIFVIDAGGTIKAHLVGAQTEKSMRQALAKAGIGG